MHYDNLIVTDFDTDDVVYVPGQGHVSVTTVCVIVVLHAKNVLLFITFLT